MEVGEAVGAGWQPHFYQSAPGQLWLLSSLLLFVYSYYHMEEEEGQTDNCLYHWCTLQDCARTENVVEVEVMAAAERTDYAQTR